MGTLFERTVSLDAEKTYSELKTQLFQQNSKLLIDDPSKHLVVEQGSLMGITPKGVKKRIDCYFHPQGENQTRVIVKSSLAPDWVKWNIGSYVFSAFLIVILSFFTYGFESGLATQRSSFSSELAEMFGLIDYSDSLFAINLLKLMVLVLIVLVLVCVLVDLIIYKKRYSPVEEALWVLP